MATNNPLNLDAAAIRVTAELQRQREKGLTPPKTRRQTYSPGKGKLRAPQFGLKNTF